MFLITPLYQFHLPMRARMSEALVTPTIYSPACLIIGWALVLNYAAPLHSQLATAANELLPARHNTAGNKPELLRDPFSQTAHSTITVAGSKHSTISSHRHTAGLQLDHQDLSVEQVLDMRLGLAQQLGLALQKQMEQDLLLNQPVQEKLMELIAATVDITVGIADSTDSNNPNTAASHTILVGIAKEVLAITLDITAAGRNLVASMKNLTSTDCYLNLQISYTNSCKYLRSFHQAANDMYHMTIQLVAQRYKQAVGYHAAGLTHNLYYLNEDFLELLR